MMKHTSDGVPAGGHDSHSPSLQTSPGSHLTKLNPYREFGRISETDLAVACTALEGNSARRMIPTSALDKRTYRTYTDVQNRGLQGTHGFPKSKIGPKDTSCTPDKNQMENLKQVVATGQVSRFWQ
jgi:hypothetical protein